MLDLLLGYGISYSDYYTGWNTTTGADGKPADYINYTTSILTGGATTCILPPLGGRSATIGGSDLKIVVDWMGMLALLGGDGAITANPKSISIGKSILGWPLGPPAGTSTDFIFGEKNGINYGRARDTTITRKKSPTFEIKTIKSQNSNLDAPLFSPGHKALIGLPYLAIIALYTTSRALVLFGSANSTIILHTNISLANLTPRLQSTWIATMLAYERLMAVEKKLKDIAKILNQHTEAAENIAEAQINRLMELPKNTLISATLQTRINYDKLSVNDSLKGSKTNFTADLTKAVDFLKNITTLTTLGNEPENELATSNANLVSYYNALTYSTIEKIELQATDFNKSQTTLQLTPRKIDANSGEVSLKIGEIDGSPGNVEIKVQSDNDKANIYLGFAGKSFSHINITNNKLLIESGKDNKKNPIIELSEGMLMIRCGPAETGPKILFNNDQVMITAGNRLARTGPKFVMTNDGIELAVGAGPAQSALKISSDGIEIKSGATASTKWSATGIKIEAAENKIEIGLAKIQENAVMAEKNTQAINILKSTLENLEADLKNIKAGLANNA